MAILGSTLGGMVLERMKDVSFRRWSDRILTAVTRDEPRDVLLLGRAEAVGPRPAEAGEPGQ